MDKKLNKLLKQELKTIEEKQKQNFINILDAAGDLIGQIESLLNTFTPDEQKKLRFYIYEGGYLEKEFIENFQYMNKALQKDYNKIFFIMGYCENLQEQLEIFDAEHDKQKNITEFLKRK